MMTGTNGSPENPFCTSFWEEIVAASFSQYLASTPFCSSGNFGKELTPGFFFERMFVNTERAGRKAESIADAHSRDRLERSSILMVVGDRGSGKTTLVHSAFRLKHDNSLASGKVWSESDNCYVVDFEDNAWVVSHKIRSQLEHQGIAGITWEPNAELTQMALSSFIANTLLDYEHGPTPPLWTLFTMLYPFTEHQRSVLARVTPGGELERFFDKFGPNISKRGQGRGEKFPRRTDVQEEISGYGVQPLVYLAAFSVLASILNRKTRDDTYLVFDNIDCIGSERLSMDVFEDICGLSEHIAEFMTEYVADVDGTHEIRNSLHHLVQIVLARQTTMDIIASTRQEALRWTRGAIDTSNVYDMDTVLDRRLGLYRSACLAEGLSAADRIGDLAVFVGQPIVSRELPRLFNGNERVLSYVVARLVDDAPRPLHLAANELRRVIKADPDLGASEPSESQLSRDDRARVGLARGVVLHYVLHRLDEEGYLGELSVLLRTPTVHLKPMDQSRDAQSATSVPTGMPVALCLLILLDNVRKGYGPPESSVTDGMRLDHLLQYFEPFFANSPEGLEALAETMWRLYWRENDEIWCRMLRINGLGPDGLQTLLTAARSFSATARAARAHNNPWIRISDAGSAFTNLLFDHFEFALWKGSRSEPSPLLTAMHELSVGELSAKIDGGLAAFQDLSAPLERVIETCFPQRSLFSAEERPIPTALPFVTQARNRAAWQYYTERKVFTALRYIDDARWLCAIEATSDSHRDALNRSFVERQLALLSLFGTDESPGPFSIREERKARLYAQRDRLKAIHDNPANWRDDIWSLGGE